MCLLIFLFSFDLDNSVLFGLDKKPPIELFFFGHGGGKNMVVSKRIQILNRQFNTLNSNANFYFNYVACVSCKCFKYKLLVAIRKRQCSILVCLVHLKRIIEKSKNRMPISMSLVF